MTKSKDRDKVIKKVQEIERMEQENIRLRAINKKLKKRRDKAIEGLNKGLTIFFKIYKKEPALRILEYIIEKERKKYNIMDPKESKIMHLTYQVELEKIEHEKLSKIQDCDHNFEFRINTFNIRCSRCKVEFKIPSSEGQGDYITFTDLEAKCDKDGKKSNEYLECLMSQNNNIEDEIMVQCIFDSWFKRLGDKNKSIISMSINKHKDVEIMKKLKIDKKQYYKIKKELTKSFKEELELSYKLEILKHK